MPKSRRAMRRAVLLRLFSHLKPHFNFELPENVDSLGAISDQEIDALLSFRSDYELDELRGALTRIENGTYGICLSCKRLLRQALLDREPTRRLCPECELQFQAQLKESYLSASLGYQN